MSVPKKVLIAEDSSVIQNLTKKILQQQDYEIRSVKNGQELMKVIEAEDFDVILLDINMPIISGIEFLESVRAQGQYTPFIFLTGYADKDTAIRALHLGAFDFLEKPWETEQFIGVLSKALKLGQQMLLVDDEVVRILGDHPNLSQHLRDQIPAKYREFLISRLALDLKIRNQE